MYNFPNYGYYDYSMTGLPDIAFGVIIALMLFMFLAFAYSVLVYVLGGIGMYTLGQKRGMKNAFLAFIPIANVFFLGKIADDIGLTMNKKTNYAQKLLIFCIMDFAIAFFLVPLSVVIGLATGNVAIIIGMLMFFVYIVLMVISICYMVFYYIALFKVYKEYSPNNAVLFEVLSILLSLYPFFLFAIRNNKSGYEKWRERQAEMQAQKEREEQEVVIEVTEETLTESKKSEDEEKQCDEIVSEVIEEPTEE